MEVKKQSYPQQHLLLQLVAIGAALHPLPQTVMLLGKEGCRKEALQMLVATYRRIARKVCKRMFYQHYALKHAVYSSNLPNSFNISHRV